MTMLNASTGERAAILPGDGSEVLVLKAGCQRALEGGDSSSCHSMGRIRSMLAGILVTLEHQNVIGIAIAALGGAAVGLEREWSGHAGGPGALCGQSVRTHIKPEPERYTFGLHARVWFCPSNDPIGLKLLCG